MKDPIPTRSTLLRRVRDPEDAEGWNEFRRTYEGLIQRLAVKAGLTPEEAKDVSQEVFIGIARNIKGFEYDPARCSFKRWLSNLVRWRILDRLAMRAPFFSAPEEVDPDSADEERHGAMAPDLEAIWDAEWQAALIEAATDRTRRRVAAKQFQIFYLHVLNQVSAAEVARQLNVNRGQVYLAKLRVGRVFRRILNELKAGNGPDFHDRTGQV